MEVYLYNREHIPIELCRLISEYIKKPMTDESIHRAICLLFSEFSSSGWTRLEQIVDNPTQWTTPEKAIELLHLAYGKIEDWDTSFVTDMSYLFMYCNLKSMKKESLRHWNVSQVTTMASMFSGQTDFNADLSLWDVSKVEDMSEMFLNCRKFNRRIEKWNMSSVKNAERMFEGCGPPIAKSKKCNNSPCEVLKVGGRRMKLLKTKKH